MRILGITAEYNPFHNGHKYHLEQSRRLTEPDVIVAAMSGNFTQRGETAVLDKWVRSRLAVENGVDLVVELPFVYACNRAAVFAKGAVDILAGLGADCISFGSESGSMEELESLARSMERNAPELEALCRTHMKRGFSHAKGFQLAAEELLGKERSALMLEPNNILALEYLRRIFFWHEKGQALRPVTLKRQGSGYFAKNEEAGFAGAGMIRRMLEKDDTSGDAGKCAPDSPTRCAPDGSTKCTPDDLAKYVPENVAKALGEAQTAGSGSGQACVAEAENRAFQLIRGFILRESRSALAEIYCVGEGLENKLKKEAVRASSMKELVTGLVSRRYTEAAVRRILIYVLMGLRERQPDREQGLYIRVLAAGPKGRALLRRLQDGSASRLPIITNVNKDVEECGAAVRKTLHYDLLAADLYNLLLGRDLYARSDKVVKPCIY